MFEMLVDTQMQCHTQSEIKELQFRSIKCHRCSNDIFEKSNDIHLMKKNEIDSAKAKIFQMF